MTRIRSTREVSITPPGAPRTSGANGKPGANGAGAQRFETLYESARQQAGAAWRDETQQQESPGDPAPDDDAERGGDDSGDARDQEAAEGIGAAAAPSPVLPAVPPLPPSLALNAALLALRENRRASAAAARAQGPARKTGVRGAPPTSAHGAAQHAVAEPSFGMQMIRRCARAAEGDLLAEHLAERVAGFCTSPAVERTGQWEVAVELDPSILPRTELRLSLSGWGLSLRFDSRDARARQLICDNSNELKTRLEARLGGRVAVEVTVI